MNKISRNTHTGKSQSERSAYLSKLKTPRAADPTLQTDEDEFTISPKENESNINRDISVSHRQYTRKETNRKRSDYSVIKIVAEIVVGIMVLIVFLIAVTLNREVGEHSVKIETLKEKVSGFNNELQEQTKRITNIEEHLMQEQITKTAKP